MERIANRLIAFVLIIAAIVASLPSPVLAPGTPAAGAGGGQGRGQVVAAPLNEAARALPWLDS